MCITVFVRVCSTLKMSTHKTTDEVLKLFETCSLQELQEKLDDFLPPLISSLSVEDENFKAIKVVNVLLHTCLPLVNIHNVENKILKFAFPVVKQLFLESINGIRFKLQNEKTNDQDAVVDHIEGLLKVCFLLLENVESCLHYVLSCEKVNASEIPSLPKNVADILLEAFKHCKESEQLYGAFFQLLGEDLSTLFKKGHAIQSQLIAALTTNIEFNSSYEEDLVMLIEVLEVLEEIGEIVTGLDIKTMANQWKLYAKIVQENAEYLKHRLDISRPLKFLSLDIINGLQSILESDLHDSKNVTKNLKVLNFSLKLVMLFCEQYGGHLGESHDELLILMLHLLSHSHPYPDLKKIPENVIGDIETYLAVGVKALVARLIKEEEFSRVYFQFGETLYQKSELKLGFLLISNVLIKNLINSDEGVQRHWLQKDPNNNIINVVFKSLEYSHLEMTLNLQIKVSYECPSVSRKNFTHGLYETLLISLSALARTLSVERMMMLEKTLLENILQGNGSVWRALMAVDVWCIIARCGPADFCFKQISALSKLGVKILTDKSCPETSYVRMLLGRLFPLLSIDDAMKLSEAFPPLLNSRLWHVFGLRKFPERLKTQLQEEFLVNAVMEIEKFFSSPPNVILYNNMMDALIGASAALESFPKNKIKENDTVKRLASKIVDLWAAIPVLNSSQGNLRSLKWLDYFLNDLSVVTATISQELTNNQTLQILNVLQHKMLQNLYSIKIASMKILRSFSTKFFVCDTHQPRVLQEIATIFSFLMKDSNVLIQQLALEEYTSFSHLTQHDKIITYMGDCEEVKRLITNYLKKIPSQIASEENVTLEEYLKKQSLLIPLHHCNVLEKNAEFTSQDQTKGIFEPSNSNILKSTDRVESQKRKVDDDLFVRVKRMRDDIKYITEAHARNTLPPDLQEEVQEMVSKLTSIT